MRREARSLSRRAKDAVMDNAARIGRVASAIPGLGSYVYQGEHPLMALLECYRVEHVLDVGANEGQFAARLRLLGYRGRITSFEPVAAAYGRLRERAGGDPAWTAVHTALGDSAGEAEIHVAENTALSSILSPSDRFADQDPDAAIAYTERVPVGTLDAVAAGLPTERTFLKIDAQGYEAAIFDGASEVLETCAGVQVELSLGARFYDGEASADDLRARARQHGLTEVVLNPLVHTIRWGELIQADAIFWRLGLEP